ncbi:ribonuclease P [Candidatus Woesearchaeota archaeon]|nr:MAG: ribonuclease P [Candidatus Woesearchaeota archaeon]
MKRKQHQTLKIARRRVNALLEQAQMRPAYANRYALLATKILQKFRLKKTPEQKLRICKKCSAYLVPGKTMRVRTTNGKLSITCTSCKYVRRIHFTREKNLRRKHKKEQSLLKTHSKN